jgi:hypothetical protein
MMHEGTRIEELWITDWKNVGIEAGDFRIFRSFSNFVGELTHRSPGRPSRLSRRRSHGTEED